MYVVDDFWKKLGIFFPVEFKCESNIFFVYYIGEANYLRICSSTLYLCENYTYQNMYKFLRYIWKTCNDLLKKNNENECLHWTIFYTVKFIRTLFFHEIVKWVKNMQNNFSCFFFYIAVLENYLNTVCLHFLDCWMTFYMYFFESWHYI